MIVQIFELLKPTELCALNGRILWLCKIYFNKTVKTGKKIPFRESFFFPTCMCVLSCFVKGILEFGTWSKKIEKCCSNPTSKWELNTYYSWNTWYTCMLIHQAFIFQNLLEAYQKSSTKAVLTGMLPVFHSENPVRLAAAAGKVHMKRKC